MANEKTINCDSSLGSMLVKLLLMYQPKLAKEDVNFLKEFILWALVELKQLSKKRTENGILFNDVFDSYIKSM